jgi:hypothetical protein
MAKKSAIEKNNKRKALAERYAAKRAQLKAAAMDENLSLEDRFKARIGMPVEEPLKIDPVQFQLPVPKVQPDEALGLALPATAGVEGHAAERAAGRMVTVPPGGRWSARMRMVAA